MKHFLHLLGHELLRLKWPLLVWLGLLLMELGLQAWLVFGPVGKDWPQEWGVEILPWLRYPALLFLTAALFLEHTNVGPRNAFLTQPIPRFLFPAVKLTFFAAALGLWGLQLGAVVLFVHGSEAASFWALAEEHLLGPVIMSLLVAWLAAQSQTPVGMAKHLALWAIGTYAAAPLISNLIARINAPLSGDWRLAALVLAPPVIALHYLTRRRWPKIAVSISALLLLFFSQSLPMQVSSGPGFPPEPTEVAGKAMILSNENGSLFDIRLRLEPGLLAEDEFALIANVSPITTGGERLPRTGATWQIEELVALRRRCLERSENLETAARVENAGPTGPELLGGEAILRVFRLEPLPVTLAPEQEEITFRIHGRNHRISVDRTHTPPIATLIAPGIKSANQLWTPWNRDLTDQGLTLIRGTEPGQPPLLLFQQPWHYDTSPFYGYRTREFTEIAENKTGGLPPPRDLTRKRLEFFEDRFVRVLRVRLIPSS